jgi:pimeloyl-ACP methyl ester carboxylesterase
MNVSSYLEVADGRIAYEVGGPEDGGLVVCAHGMGDTRRTFRFLAPKLAEAGYRVALMDVRGYGESAAVWPTYDSAAVGGDILALIQRLGGGPAVVVVHSIACASAVAVAAQAPGEISKVVLISTSSGDDDQVKWWMKLAAGLVARNAGLWGMYYRTLYPTHQPADLPGYVTALKANLREPGRLGALRAQINEAMSGVQMRYGEVRCPVLIVMGAKDKDSPNPSAEAEASARKLTGPATVEVIPDVGHYPHAEAADTTAKTVLAFLELRG